MKLFFLPVFALVAACQPVGIAQQGRLSHSVFDFQGTGTATYEVGLTSQIEPGRASSSNVSAGGCASCQ